MSDVDIKWNHERSVWTIKETDRYFVEVMPQMFNLFAVVMTPKALPGTYDDRWDYHGLSAALLAAICWDADTYPDTEPTGWHRHLPTGRRRKDGDPSTEHIQP